MLSAPVDEEDGEEEEKEGEAAEGGHEDDPGVWREKNGAKSQAGSRNALSRFGEELQGADSLASRLGAATPQLECPVARGNLRHLLELLFSLSKQGQQLWLLYWLVERRNGSVPTERASTVPGRWQTPTKRFIPRNNTY